MPEVLDASTALESTTVAINRTSTTVKGGRRLSFSALVVVGDRGGSVGVGYGKGRGVPVAIEKAQKAARKNIFKITNNAGTIPHVVVGKYLSSKVRLIPAAPGTGVIAGGTVRAVLEMAGIQDCLTKAYGSTNKANLCKAVVDALKQLRSREEIASFRGVEIVSSAVDEMLEASAHAQDEVKTESRPAQIIQAPAKPEPEAAPEPEAEAKTEESPVAEAEAPAEEASTEASETAEAPAEEAPADAEEQTEEKKEDA
ncbi:MAG: 30S ribosomal protein S5 [Planctomycetota bacterium]